jgi:hypothetical protein
MDSVSGNWSVNISVFWDVASCSLRVFGFLNLEGSEFSDSVKSNLT